MRRTRRDGKGGTVDAVQRIFSRGSVGAVSSKGDEARPTTSERIACPRTVARPVTNLKVHS